MQLQIIECQNKILTDEINTDEDIRDPSASEQAKQLHMTNKKQ